MTREELKDIFQAPFSYANWSNLLTYLFAGAGKNCQLKPEAAPVAMDNVDDSEMDGYYLGEVSFGLQKLKLYAFHVKDATTNIKRNRVGLRNTVSYIKDYDDAAIVVYYNDTQWRVSYIRDIITAPKRYTYVFGESHNRYSTPISRFELLTKGDINFDTIYKAFEVEALGDDFFKEYKKRYQDLCKSKNLTTKNQRDYVKKMMGRLVFLQFLQKKGWMCSNYNYLQDLYVNSEYKDDFLEKVLEPLFFGVLNTKECDRNAEKLKVLGEKVDIPYLNGGLFEQDTEDSKYYRFDKSHFEGLFDFFSHYNFTIDENDPNDAEVGIDPEMLGHIFENLLEDNNDKGAFYTPKEIVQYMSRESLIQYLKTHTEERLHPAIVRLVNDGKVDDLLQNRDNANEINNYICSVKICDPAIGSGAFPMGLLNELFHCRQLLYGFTQTNGEFIPAQVKREIIQNNIFGVDIEQGAVDIARLRFWLALVVDETEKLPLPNLDYKIMCGNSLLSRYTMDMSLKEAFANYNSGKSPEDQLTGEKYKKLVADFTSSCSGGAKTSARNIIAEIKAKFNAAIDLRDRAVSKADQKLIGKYSAYLKMGQSTMFDSAVDESKLSKESQKELNNIRRKLAAKASQIEEIKNNKLYEDAFEWRFEFPALLGANDEFVGFDIVIGNPPYIQLQANEGLLGDMYKDAGFETFARTGDIYSLFYERGIQLLRTGGIEAFITSSKWMRAAYGAKTRAFFAKNNPLYLLDLGANVFDSATVDTNILIIAKGQNQNGMLVASAKEKLVDVSTLSFSSMPSNNSDNWIILSPIEQSIKQKIDKVGVPLKEWNININRGVVTGYNNAFIISTSKKTEILSNCRSDHEREATRRIIRPILRGKDIQCFNAIWADLWIIYIPWHFPMHDNPHLKGASVDAELAFENDYPALYNYLFAHKSSLMLRNKEETGIRYEWYSLQRWGANYWHELDNDKIIWKRIGSILRFSFDTSKSAVLDSTCFATGEGLRYLVAVLNSKMGNYLFKDAPKTGTGDLLISVQAVNPVKVPQLTEEQQQPYIDRVNQILEKKSENPQADTSALEAEIDQMVYTLYNLTPEEITLIENR